MELAREKGGSSTLTTIPISEHGFFFEVKSDFHDHVHLRYCWPLDNLPPTCPCGSDFTIDHAQICKLSGFINMRHDDPTTFLAYCMKEAYHDVELEPPLQPLTGETLRDLTANSEPDTRADIRVRGFWTDGRNAFFDTRVFYPHAPSYRSRGLHFNPCTGSLSRTRSVSTPNASKTLSTALSHPWSSRHAVGLGVRPWWSSRS